MAFSEVLGEFSLILKTGELVPREAACIAPSVAAPARCLSAIHVQLRSVRYSVV